MSAPGGDEFGGYVVPVPINLEDGTRFTLLCERDDGIAICQQCGTGCRPERFVPAGHCDCCGGFTHVSVLCDWCADVIDRKREAEGDRAD